MVFDLAKAVDEQAKLSGVFINSELFEHFRSLNQKIYLDEVARIDDPLRNRYRKLHH